MISPTQFENIRVIDRNIALEKYVAIDLSVNNPDLTDRNLADPADFGKYIDSFLSDANALAAYGGYDERRDLYRSSSIFNDDSADERDIHIGIDIWAPAGTSVIAAVNGSVHSFNFNAGKGNYGPTIILEHKNPVDPFYTLYGHLSVESIESIEIGDVFEQGEEIGKLGDASVNGGYPPHLHFQIISEMDGNSGDYPGVCSEKDRIYYLGNCPDPNIMLQLKNH